MNFLAKAGSILLRVIGIASGIAPTLNPLVPQKDQGALAKVESEIGAIGGVITTTEAMAQSILGTTGNGAAKLKAATPFVSQIIQSSELMVSHKVKDEAAFTAAVTTITSGFADLLNSVEQK